MTTYEIKTNNGSKFVSASTRKIAINKAFGLTEKSAVSLGLMVSAKKAD